MNTVEKIQKLQLIEKTEKCICKKKDGECSKCAAWDILNEVEETLEVVLNYYLNKGVFPNFNLLTDKQLKKVVRDAKKCLV